MIKTVVEWVQMNPFLDFIILIAIPSVFEVSKIKINPWSWLAKKIGNAINSSVIERLDKIEERQDKCEKERLNDKADSARTRIIRGADEIRIGQLHSKEYFDNLLQDIDFYKDYCRKNESYQNEKAVFAIRSVEEIYQKCLKENSFL